jgi:hypothetical protein
VTSTKDNDEMIAKEIEAGRIKAKDVRAVTHIGCDHFVPGPPGSNRGC